MNNRYQLLFDEIVLFPLLSLIKDGVEVNSLVIDQLIKGQEGEYFMLINKLLNNQTLLGRIPYFIDVLNKIRNVMLINNRDNLLKLIRLKIEDDESKEGQILSSYVKLARFNILSYLTN